jgi:hypothetical protein
MSVGLEAAIKKQRVNPQRLQHQFALFIGRDACSVSENKHIQSFLL